MPRVPEPRAGAGQDGDPVAVIGAAKLRQLLAEDGLVYVPAAADYLPPEVEIEAPTAGAEFEAGEPVTFSASEVQQGKAPFTYMWSSSHDGVLGSGSTLTVPLTPASLKKYDCIIISTDHDAYDYDMIVKNAKLVIDTRNACVNVKGAKKNVYKA